MKIGLGLWLGAQPAAGGGAPPVVIPVNTVAPTLTDAQADGETQTLDYGTWTNAATLSIAYVVDGTTVQTYSVDYGDPAPTRAYDYATEVGRLRSIEVTATSSTGGVSEPAKSPVRVGEPNNTHILGEGKTALAIIDGSNEYPWKNVDRLGTIYTDATALRPTWTNGAMTWAGAAPGNRWWTCDLGGTVDEVEFEFPIMEIVAGGDIPAGQLYGEVRACAVPYDTGTGLGGNSTGVAASLANQNTVYRLQVNVFLDNAVIASGLKQIDIPKANITANPVIKLQRRVAETGNPQWRAIINDNEAMATAWSVDITDAKLRNADKIIRHIYGSLGSGTFPWKSLNSIKVKTLPTNYISISVTASERSPDDPNKLRITLGGAEVGASTVQYAVVSQGAVVLDWTTAEAVSGTLSKYLDVPLTNGETYTVYCRDAATPSLFGTASGTAPVLQSVQPMQLGMQHGYLASWSDHDIFNDRGYKAVIGIRAGGTDYSLYQFGVDVSGGCLATPDGAGNSLKIVDDKMYPVTGFGSPQNIWYESHASFPEAGVATMIIPTGLAGVTIDAGTATGVTAYNPANGQISWNAVAGFNVANRIKVRVPWANVPVGGLPLRPQVQLHRTGNAEPDPLTGLTPEAQTQLSSLCTVYRGMTPQGGNDLFRNANLIYGGRTATTLPVRAHRWRGPGMTAEDMATICSAAGLRPWDVGISMYDTDELIADQATVYALSPLGAQLLVEGPNEVWNYGFQVYHDMSLAGVRAGYAPDSVTNSSLAVPETILDGFYLGFNGATRLFPVDIDNGSKVVMNVHGAGWVCYRALKDIPAGTLPVPASLGSDANWQLVYTTAQVGRARWRALAKHIQRVKAIVDPIMATHGKPAPQYVLGSALVVGFATDVKYALDFDNFRQDLIGGGIALNSYGPNYGAYRNANWPRAGRDQVYHDFAAADASYAAAITTAQLTAVDTMVAYKQSVADDLVANGEDKDAIAIFSYEGLNDHFTGGTDWPDQAPVWAAGTAYSSGQFALGSDGQTYVALSGTTGNDPISSPTQWAVFQDAVQEAAGLGEKWDADFTESVRYPVGTVGSYVRPSDRWQHEYQRSAAHAAVLEPMLERIKNEIGSIHCRFQLNQETEGRVVTSVAAPTNYDFYSWGMMRNETDTNPVSTVFADLQATLVA